MTLQIERRVLFNSLALSVGMVGLPWLSRTAASAVVPAPADKAILTVSGKVSNTNREGAIDFDRAMLEGIGLTAFVTTTPWYNGEMKFEGVLMSRLMSFVGAKGDKVTALALNDYSTDIPMEDLTAYKVILALKRNGEYMPVNDKGPLFVVYPYDSDPALKHQRYYSRSAWQVRRMIVK